METINLKSNVQTAMMDITKEVKDVVQKSGIVDGICMVFVPHTSAAITLNDNSGPDIRFDIVKETNKVIQCNGDYKYDGNSAAHVKACFYGFSVHVIIEKGNLVLGNSQGIYFCEFDGPRTREVNVKIMKG